MLRTPTSAWNQASRVRVTSAWNQASRVRARAITQPASGLHARPCARCRAWCRLHAGAITYSVPQAESTKLSTPGGKRTARFLLFLLFSFLHLGFSFLTAPYNTCSNRRIKVQELSRGELVFLLPTPSFLKFYYVRSYAVFFLSPLSILISISCVCVSLSPVLLSYSHFFNIWQILKRKEY